MQVYFTVNVGRKCRYSNCWGVGAGGGGAVGVSGTVHERKK